MTTHLTPRGWRTDAVGAPRDGNFTFSAKAEVTSGTVYTRGVLDLVTAELLRGTVDVLLGAGQLDVRIDLGGVRYVDRAGMSLLGTVWSDLEHRGGSLTLVNARPAIRHRLASAGLPVEATMQDL